MGNKINGNYALEKRWKVRRDKNLALRFFLLLLLHRSVNSEMANTNLLHDGWFYSGGHLTTTAAGRAFAFLSSRPPVVRVCARYLYFYCMIAN